MAQETEGQGTSVVADPLDSDFGKVAEPAVAPAAADPRPRNSDGTFKKLHQHETYIVNAARSFGYTQEEIDETPPSQLTREVTKIYQNREAMREKNATQRTLDRSEERTQAAVQAAPPEEDFSIPEDELAGIATIQPGTAKLLKLLPAKLKDVLKENAELKKWRQDRDQLDAEREKRTTLSVVDDAFESLGSAGEQWFGKGSMAGLVDQNGDPVGDEGFRRNVVYQRAKVLPGDTSKTVERKIREAAKLFIKESPAPAPAPEEGNLYGKSTAAPKPAVVERPIVVNGRDYSEDEWAAAYKNGSAAKPTHRQVDDLPPGEEKAIKTVSRHLNESAAQQGQQSRVQKLGLLNDRGA